MHRSLRCIAFFATLTPVFLPATLYAQVPVFEPPVPLTAGVQPANDGDDSAPTAAVTNGAGTWLVAWNAHRGLQGALGNDEDVLFARSTDGGLTFSAPAALNTNAANDGGEFGTDDTTVAVAAHGDRFIAVWHKGTLFEDSIMLARSDDAGAHWTDPAELSTGSLSPSIATDGAGTWVIAWRYGVNAFFDTEIYFTRSVDDGMTWTPPDRLNTNWASEDLTDLSPSVVWANGVWVAVWTAIVPPQAAERHALYARSVNGGATWSVPAPLDANGPTVVNSSPRVASDGSGAWVAVWESENSDDLLVARSTDAALTWTTPVPLNTDFATDTRDEYVSSVTAAGPGRYTALWTRMGTPSDLNANHGDALTATSIDAGITWSPPVPLNPANAAAETPFIYDLAGCIAYDPLGYLLAFWASNDATLASGTKGKDMDVIMALADHPCGNGALDAGESCDDGDRGSLDCCGRACAYDPAGAVCAADADPCTLERCDGAGTCLNVNAPLGTPCAVDGDSCTLDRCDGNDVCEHAFEPRPTCDVPAEAGSSALTITDDAGEKSLSWSMKRGPATTLGQLSLLITGANYSLCMYDDSGLLMRGDMPTGTCGSHGKSCWKASNTSLKYADRDGTPNGVLKALLRSGAEGQTRFKVKGGGANLMTPSLPITSLPLSVQLISEDMGTCFEATYSAAGVESNSTAEFSASSD
jgi:hypothetical protein